MRCLTYLNLEVKWIVDLRDIGVVIPAYNAEKTIAGVIKQAISYGFEKNNVIVVNDGSTDRTEDEVKLPLAPEDIGAAKLRDIGWIGRISFVCRLIDGENFSHLIDSSFFTHHPLRGGIYPIAGMGSAFSCGAVSDFAASVSWASTVPMAQKAAIIPMIVNNATLTI